MARIESSSILRRPFNRIDDEHFYGPALRVELQPELLLNRGEERRSVARWGRSLRRAAERRIRRPRQVGVESACQSCLVDDASSRNGRKIPREVRHRYRVHLEMSIEGSHATENLAVALWPAAAGDSRGHFLLAVRRGRMQLRTERVIGFREDERVDRHVASLAMRDELAPVREQALEHRQHFRTTRIPFGFGDDVPAIGVDPFGTADDLKPLQTPRVANDVAERIVRDGDAARLAADASRLAA